MGVPKFYRWISQRYPCINQTLKENEAVPIDHLYLDLNGIIHSSSHCDGVVCVEYDEDKVFQTIAKYINHIVNLMKPRRTLFLAVDGVAPRAKMTQQRARRFLGPKQVANEVRKLREKGQNIDENSIFDSNVISPGTEFMARLHGFFKNYIANQISTDPIWRRVDIIYSGHDAPGEGEQKIREYMSHRRSLPGYLPNERHCMYGMDADLIFLGLATHEPNLCILRENVYKVKSPIPQDIPFCLVHLSLLREYIGLEFKDLELELSFPFDLERIIDDWIFMGYLLGNDFIPNLPNMHIHAESFIFLWDTYHVVLPKLNGYINEFGKLNLERFHIFITELSSFDMHWFVESQADQRWMHGKHGAKMARELLSLGKQATNFPQKSPPSVSAGPNLELEPKPPSATEESIVGFFSDDAVTVRGLAESDNERLAPISVASMHESDPARAAQFEEIEEDLSDEEDAEEGDLSSTELSPEDDGGYDDEEEDETELIDEVWLDHRSHSLIPPSLQDGNDSEEDDDTIAYRMNRQNYYLKKLKIDIRGTSNHLNEVFVESALLSICREYVKTLQWVLDYYFKSVVDWKYYYPYHYAPFVSDLSVFTKRFLKDGVEHEKRDDWADFVPNTGPLLPFEQQMFIMPIASSKILPQPYRCLFDATKSPVSEFFPEEFETDINGKLAEWEAVVLIPFIDEAKMLAAMAPYTQLLSPEDARRNIHRGHLVLLVKDREKLDFADANHAPTFEDLVTMEVDSDFYRSHVLRDPDQCFKVYCQLPRSIDLAYPSLYRLPFKSTIERVGVKTFSFASKGQSILLTVDHPLGRSNNTCKPDSLQHVAKTFLGQLLYTGWPYSRLVIPVALMDEKQIFEVDMSTGMKRIVDRTDLRNKPDSPYWSSVRWLKSQSDWCVMLLHDRCAINLAGGQPRAALLCLPVSDFSFSLSINNRDSSHVTVHPSCLQTQNLNKMIYDLRSPHRRNRRAKGLNASRINKQSLLFDANVSVSLSSEATLEILDLTIDPTTSAAFDRSLFDVFPRASNVIIFSRIPSSLFGRLGEVVKTTPDNFLTIKLHPEVPLHKNLTGLLEKAIMADETSYLTPQQMSRELRLTQHTILRIVGDVMVRIPPPPADTSNSSARRFTARSSDDRRNFANIGFSLCLHDDRACVVGWSHFSVTRDCWLFSRRTVDAIAKYNQLFPEVVNFIGSRNKRIPPVEMSAIYPTNTFERYAELRAFLRTEVKGNRTVTDVGAPLLDKEGLRIIQTDLLPDISSSHVSSEVSQVDVAPIDVFAILPEGGRIVPQSYQIWLKSVAKSLDKFVMLDRVVYVGPRREIFGIGGFVVGVYPILGEETIEVMFDRTFDGAVSIRGSSPLCMVVPAAYLLHYPHPVKSGSSMTELSNAAKKFSPKEDLKHTTTSVKHPKVSGPVGPLDTLLPPEWLETPPVEFASESTAPLASSSFVKKTPKQRSISASKTSQRKFNSRSTANGNNNSTHSSTSLNFESAKKNASNKPNLEPFRTRQEIQYYQPRLIDHSETVHEHLSAVTNAQIAPQLVPTMETCFVDSPQPPGIPPPSAWQIGDQSCIVDGGLLDFYVSPCSPPPSVLGPLDPQFKPHWLSDGSIVFFNTIDNAFYTAADLRNWFYQTVNHSFQPITQPQQNQQPQMQQWLSSVPPIQNASEASMSTKSLDPRVFVPIQARQAALRTGRH